MESVYQKVLLGDIIARNNVRNPQAMRVLMKKVAETVHNEASSTMLHGMLKGVGYKVSKDSVINYLAMAQEAYLIFSICNAVAKFVEREGNPRYYFTDNGLLNLFLTKRESVLLENALAIALYDAYGDALHYLKSSKNGIDVDFYVPDEGLAVQVAYSLSENSNPREVGNLIKLARVDEDTRHFVIVTKDEEGVIEKDGVHIEVLPAWKFLLELAADGDYRIHVFRASDYKEKAIVSIDTALLVKSHISFQSVQPLLVKRHVLFQKKCQKPHSVSKGLTFPQVDFFRMK
ncbi:DUF4143 domain-containing protein [Olegusella massiliensis]|uniref:DUF4143 domain-containing protein n=1 Tax=Olegusella massiliensis TaxID=1776381 RepID=UPI0023F7591B|nr:hypothetical protein [Olegusella massiliensis]